MCVAFACGNGGRLSPQATKQLRQESPAFWVLWLSGYLVSDQVEGSLGEGNISNFPLYSILLPTFFVEANGGVWKSWITFGFETGGLFHLFLWKQILEEANT